jgi:ribosome-associated protein
VNTSSTRIELTWNVLNSVALTGEMRARVLEKLAGRIDGEGFLRVVSSESRSQRRNRTLAEERLAETVRAALVVPKKRRPTRPSRASKQARLDSKKKQSEKKRNRRVDSDS